MTRAQSNVLMDALPTGQLASSYSSTTYASPRGRRKRLRQAGGAAAGLALSVFAAPWLVKVHVVNPTFCMQISTNANHEGEVTGRHCYSHPRGRFSQRAGAIRVIYAAAVPTLTCAKTVSKPHLFGAWGVAI